MKKFFNEFKEFINRGNVMDLAVAVIITVYRRGLQKPCEAAHMRKIVGLENPRVMVN